MNKNTLLAFILILATVAFFTSPTYNRLLYKIRNKPYPEDMIQKKSTDEKKGTGADTIASRIDTIRERKTEKESFIDTIPSSDTTLSLNLKGDTVWIETDTIIAGISEIGAKLVSIKMKHYFQNNLNGGASSAGDKKYVELFPKKSDGGAGISINNTSYDTKKFSLLEGSFGKKIIIKKGTKKTISFMCHDTRGKELQKHFTIGEGYHIGFTVTGTQLTNNRLSVKWPSGIVESETGTTGMYQQEFKVVHYFIENENTVEHIQMTKPLQEEHSGFFRWLGLSSKYFFISIVADTNRDSDIKIIGFEKTLNDTINGKKNKNKKINYSLAYQITPQDSNAQFWFYTGPSRFEQLKAAHLQFEKILFPVLGWPRYFFWADKWFPPVAEFVLWLLLLLYKLTKDYGVAILLLTIISRLVTFPLTQSSMKSMNRMKELQPKITALRQKYKTNPKKMNEEMMALYKAEGVNPLNPGCLPMFLQMPVFIALFVVLQKAIELRGAGTVLVPWVHDLSNPEVVFSFTSIFPGGIPLYGSNFAILPIIMAGLTYFQNKMTIKDPNQKMLIYFMPIFMLVLFNNFASGLVLYWTLSNALGLIQQYYLEKSMRKTTVAQKAIPVRSNKSGK